MTRLEAALAKKKILRVTPAAGKFYLIEFECGHTTTFSGELSFPVAGESTYCLDCLLEAEKHLKGGR